MNIKVDMLPTGSPNRPGTAMKPKFITIHNTDNSKAGADAEAHARYVKGPDAQKRMVSWHYTVDSKQIYKHLPLSEQGFHAGTKQGNQRSIGIEICMNRDGVQRDADERAALLVAVLMRELNLPIKAVVTHNHWSGKKCPQLLLKKGAWEKFLSSVQGFLDGLEEEAEPETGPVSGRAGAVRSFIAAEESGEEEPASEDQMSVELRASSGDPAGTEPRINTLGTSFVLNARRDVPDFRDKFYEATLVEVPKEAGLASYLKHKAPILNQGKEGACTGFALAAVANFLLRRLEPDTRDCVSARMLYEMARRYDEWPGEAYEGSSARGAMKGWHKHGVCSEALWSSQEGDAGHLTEKRAKAASLFPVGAYYRVNQKDLVAMHSALVEVGILYATALVHEGWDKVSPEGHIPFPERGLGGHAFAIVGYDRDGFWIQNSWGDDWGRNGFGRISYEDWLENGTDVWVARLGVPINLSSSGGSSVSSRRLISQYGPSVNLDLRNHVICLDNDGLLAQTGPFANNVESIRAAVKQMQQTMAKWENKRVLVYAHGGLVPESSATEFIQKVQPFLMNQGVYPLFFIWRTGLMETLFHIIEDVVKRKLPSGAWYEWLEERKDDLIESAVGTPGKLFWNQMKSNAALATSSRDGGARLLADLLAEEAKQQKWEIHLTGHSAGAIFLSHFAEYLAFGDGGGDSPAIGIESCSLWAPAIRRDLFDSTFGAMVHKEAIRRLAIYTLSENAEKADNCLNVYSRSLLFLVSNAFEGARKTPLVGMEHYHDESLRSLPNIELIRSRSDLPSVLKPGTVVNRGESGSRSHGGFDNDDSTRWSTLARILDLEAVTVTR